MINNIKNKVAPYEHEGRWHKAFIEKSDNGELKLTRCDLPGAELTEDGLKLPEDFHAIDYKFDTHFTTPAVLAGQEQVTGGGGSEYELPIASANTLGGIKSSASTGLTVNNEGIPNVSLLEVPQTGRNYITNMPVISSGNLTNGRLIHCEAPTVLSVKDYPHPFELTVKFATPDSSISVPVVCQAQRDNSSMGAYYTINSTGIAKTDKYIAVVGVTGKTGRDSYQLKPTVIGVLFEITSV